MTERLRGETDAALAEAEGGKTRNVHQGSARKIDTEAARRKAGVMAAEDILDILPIPRKYYNHLPQFPRLCSLLFWSSSWVEMARISFEAKALNLGN